MSAPTTSSKAFTISDWRSYEKGSLRAFFTITTPGGMVIHDCTLHQKSDARWIGLPATKFSKADGTSSYKPMIEFIDRSVADKFRDAVLAAIDSAGLGGGRQ